MKKAQMWGFSVDDVGYDGYSTEEHLITSSTFEFYQKLVGYSKAGAAQEKYELKFMPLFKIAEYVAAQ